MKRIAIGLIVLLSPLSLGAGCAPEKMVKIIFRDGTPGVDANSAAAQPKTLYRYQARYARLEEADPAHNARRLMIANEPDMWTIDLVAKTGQHRVDSEKPSHFRSPVFGTPGSSAFLSSFEFGCELAFMKERSVTPQTATIENRTLDTYRVTEGDQTIYLAVDTQLQKPVIAALEHGDKQVNVVKYVAYDTVSNPNLMLFKVPTEVKVSEGKP